MMEQCQKCHTPADRLVEVETKEGKQKVTKKVCTNCQQNFFPTKAKGKTKSSGKGGKKSESKSERRRKAIQKGK